MANDFIGEEATGVFIGELLEDMVDTVKRTKKMYCDVHIPQFFVKGHGHPLTYVPLWALSLPLRKGDKVMVEFHQNDLTLPVLYKNDSEVDGQMFDKFDTNKSVSGGNIQGYTAENTVGAQWIGKDSYIVKTDKYTVVHQNNGFFLIDKDDKIYVYGKALNFITAGDTKIDSSGKTQVFSSSTVEVKTNADVKVQGSSTIELKTNADVNISATGGFKVNNHLQVTV